MGRLIIAAVACSCLLTSSGRAAGSRYALLVGVRDYTRAELTSLDYTENDAEGLGKVLKRAGYKRVVLMTQRSGAADPKRLPTSTNIRRELASLLGACREEDTVVVSVCGHGLQFAGSDEPYFCPMDASIKDKKTLISLSEVYDALGGCKARVKVLFSDACRNDPLPRKAREEMAKHVSAPHTSARRDKAPENVVALFSCSAGEVAYESAALKHGIFFHYLIKGLSGEAAGGKAVTLNSLTDYVQREVPSHVKGVAGASARQRPEAVGRTSIPIVLAEIDDLSVKAVAYMKAGNFQAAAETATKALEASPDSAILLAMRAHSLERQARGKEALLDADRALKIDPTLAAAYVTRGNVWLLRAHQPRRAVREYDKALARSPRHPTARLYRGKAHLLAGNLSQAEADLTEAIRLAPGSAEAYQFRAQLARRKGDNEAALSDLGRALKLAPRLGSAYYDRAMVRLAQKDQDEAMRDLNEAVKLSPRLARAWNARGNLHLEANDLRKAEADYTEAIRLKHGFAPALYNRAQVFFRNRDYRTAVADLNESLKADPRHAPVWLMRGAAHAALKDHKKAIADFDESIRRDGKRAVVYQFRARSHAALGDKEKAAADEAKARALSRAR